MVFIIRKKCFVSGQCCICFCNFLHGISLWFSSQRLNGLIFAKNLKKWYNCVCRRSLLSCGHLYMDISCFGSIYRVNSCQMLFSCFQGLVLVYLIFNHVLFLYDLLSQFGVK